MSGVFSFSKQPKYPHMRPEEVKIWERFIDLNPDFFDAVDYDVRIGSPREYPGQPLDEITKAMMELSRKRIDFVGYRGEEIFIGEIKPNALLGAFGQLIGERDLYVEEQKPTKEPKMILITNKENPDMRKLSARYGIEYFVV